MIAWRTWAALLGFVLVPLVGGGLGGLLTAPAIPGWYAQLQKPAWNPPSWVFGPVWTALYVSMGVAAWLVWRQAGFDGGRAALALFGVQLLLNFAWTPIFFGAHLLGLAFVEILFLWAAILATLVAFWHVRPAAGWLLVPYLAWVTFAAVLNFTIWRLNA